MITLILVKGVFLRVEMVHVGNVSDAKLRFHLQADVISPDHGPSHAITMTNNWQVRG